jgi:hypothetical protein
MAAAAFNVRLDLDRRKDLDLLMEDTGWSANKVINRAIKDMFALHYVHRQQAAQADKAHGDLLLHVVRDFGAGSLIKRDLGYSDDANTGAPLVYAQAPDTGERSVFYEDDHGRLLVQRTTSDGVVQHFVCREGELTLLDEHLAKGAPILN